MRRRRHKQPGGKPSTTPLRLETLERRVLFSADLPFASDILGDSAPSTAPIVGSTITGNELEAESAQAQPLELVIVDPSADDFEQVLEAAEARSDSRFQAYLLSPDVDGLAQLSDILAAHQNVSALHLVTAGTDSDITLGDSTVTLMDMLANADEVAGWGESFAAESSWQIYGSAMADSDEGLNFVTTLSDLTSTDVAVSSDLAMSAWSSAPTTSQNIQAEATDPADEERLELVFIDTDTPDHEQLLKDLLTDRDDGRHIEVVLLDSNRDGIQQISETLALYQGVDAVHLISHGTEGGVQLGDTWLSSDTLSSYETQLANWSSALSEDADLLFYGCDLAGSRSGETLVASIAQLTGADVAASTDLTGDADQGGDWELEFAVGQVESELAVSTALQQEYQGTFAIYTVTSLADSGAGSLREAITLANTSGGADTIEFGVAGTISLSSALPTIDEQLTIDGSTAPGYSGDPVVDLDGTGVSGNGLHFTAAADNSTVNSLMITNFTGNGIQIDSGADGITITGNWIGTTGTGTTGDGNSNHGIDIQGTNTIIGGTGPNEGNVITNNGNEGINLRSGATGTIIQGNIIGLDPDGSTGSGNNDVGIAVLSGAHNTTIGGTDPNAGNVISMNFEGIEINSNNNTVQGNYIGTDSTGTFDRGNRSDDGIEIKNNATGNLIGGTEEGAGNLIAFNSLDGINIVNGSGNTVLGNDIHSNGDQDIDLGAGVNNDQAAPLLASAQTSGNELTVSGSLSSTANSYFRIEFFGSNQTYLGFVNVATDGSGNATFDTTLSVSVASGTLITSTATKSDVAYSTYSDTSAYSSIVTAGNAGTAIWRDASTTPQTSDWDGSAFGPTTASAPSGDYRIMQGAEAPTRDEIIIIGVDGSSNISGEIWNGSSWSVLPGSLGSPLGTVSQNYWWGMDVQYESQSGDALMVWNDGANIEYATWDGSSWSSVNTISYSGATPRQLQLSASPNSDEMVLVVSDSNSEDFALVWDGSNWGNEQILEQVAGDDRTDIFVTYEQQSGDAMVVYGKTDIDAYYRIWNGTSWGSEGSVSQAIGASGNLRWATLASDPNSDQIALGVTTSNGDTWLNVWDGSGWGTSELATTTSTGTNHPAVAVAFESTSGDLLAAYGESGSSDVKFKTWTAGGGWSTEQIGPNIGGTPNTLMLAADPISDQIMLTAQDSNSHVNYVLWNGSSWGTPTELGTSTTETKNQPFLFLWDQQAATNEAPVNTVPATQNTAVDTALVFSSANGNAISIGDTDDTSATVTLSATDGTLTLNGNTGLSFTVGDGVGDTSMTFSGTLADINAALDGLQFDPTSVFEGFASVHFSTTDAGADGTASPENDTDTVTIEVGDVNSAPVNTVPAAQTIEQDGMLLFSSVTGTAISVSDADAGGASIQVTLAATNGTLNLQSTNGLSFTVGDGSADTDMTFTGTIADINAALEGMTFVATAGFTGSANLQIATDDLGNTGSGGALADTDNVAINVGVPDHTLWMTFENDEAATGNAELADFTGGDVVNYGGTLTFESGATSGTFSKNFNLDLIAGTDGDTKVDAVHYVTRDISVGGIDLQAGDLLLSTADTEVIGSVTYEKEDVFVFRPATAGDYSSGSFFMLIEGKDSGLFGDVTGISLVEQETVVGGVTLNAGDFLIAEGSKEIIHFEADQLGATSSGARSILIQGGDIDFGQNIGALHLVQEDTAIGDTSLQAGQLILGLVSNDSAVGDTPTINVLRQDLFLLDVSATGDGTTAATATRFFEGLDENLDNNNESIWGVSLQYNVAPTLNDATLSVNENSSNGTAVGSVSGTDPDSGTLNYAITGGNTDGAFTINATTGAITVANSAALDFETNSFFNLTVAAIDDKGAYDTATITIDLNNVDEAGVNDAPENTVPASQTIEQDGMLLFSSTTGTAISIGDFDAGSGLLQVTLDATNGTLNLSGTQGLAFSTGDGTADGTMTFTGTLADINAALEGMTFVANPGFIGSAGVQITTDDQGNTGTGGALVDTDNVAISVVSPDQSLWLSLKDDIGGSGDTENLTTTGGDVLTYGDITQFETSNTDPLASTTGGTLAHNFNLDTVLLSDGVTQASADGNTQVNAVHYVTTDIQVGSNNIQLLAGDILLSTNASEIIGGVTYDKVDVFVFRPDTAGDYSQGSFFLLIDGADIGLGNVTGMSLVEQTTVVGGVTLNADEFLLAHDGSGKNIDRFTPGSLGATTSGSTSVLVAGADIDIGQNIGGLHLVQNDTVLGGQSLNTGQLLMSLQANDSTVGDGTTIDVRLNDMFVLDVTATGDGTTAATASRLFEGLDENLDSGNDAIWGIGYQGNVAPTINADSFALDENSANSTVVGSVSASDAEPGALSYAITGGNTDGAFAIDATTGQITVANSAALDFETTPSFSLTVAAIDSQGAYGTATITVNLNDLSALVTAGQSFDITEDASNGDAVGSIVTTGDAATSFTITAGNTGGAFAVDGSGNLTVANDAALDPETTPVYTLTVEVSDGTTVSSETVTINVTAVNDAPVITSNGGGDTANINVVENTTGVTTVTSSDVDGGTPVYSISGGADAALFSLNSTTGELTFIAAPNFEEPADADGDNVYLVTVQVADGNGGSDTQVVSVTVTNQLELVVSNTNATGTGSLHEAILNANANVGVTDTITFNIGGGGPQTINVDAAGLPIITDSIILDATTQPGYSGTPLITLDGAATPAASGINGIRIQANDSTVKGFIVINFADEGIEIDGSTGFGDNNIIQNNWVGIDKNGNVAGNAEHGIMVSVDANNNQIGGTAPNEGNVVAGNGMSGIIIQQNADNNIVEGNIIGLAADGTTVAGNTDHGILISQSSDGNRIGGSTPGARNIISGNSGDGIRIDGATDATYTTAVTGTVILGNYIGTDATGNTQAGSDIQDTGITISASSGNIVGGTGAGDANVLSGNRLRGLIIIGSTSTDNVVSGNFIGTNADGSAALTNIGGGQQMGVYLYDTPGNTIGGTTAGAENVISGNITYGIYAWGPNTTGNEIQGNTIGLDASLSTAIGNGGAGGGGIMLSNAPGNLVGGTVSGAANVISGHLGAGIMISGTGGIGNTLLGNVIYDNGTLGIDLGSDGVTANDVGDADTGPNDLQNFPVISFAEISGTDLTLSGSLDTDGASTQYRIEFYGNAAGTQDATNGEARLYLGSATVTTDAGGNATFSNVTLSGVTLSAGDFVTATATEIQNPGQVGIDDGLAYGSTSEFAANIAITDVNVAPAFTSTPIITATEDAPYSYTITTSDANGDVLSINGLTVPAWLTLVDNGDGTATLSGTPTNAEVGDHSLSLEVSDGSLTATQSFTLTVSNVNDDPVITSPATFNVAENSTAVGTVTSTDVDGGAPQYTLIGAVDDGLFSIDVNSGALSFNTAPDFEAPADSGGDNVYNLTVQVDDGNGGIVNQAVTVTVTDANDNAPVVTAAQTFSVNEDALVNDVVGTVTATDADSVGSLQGWTITAGNTDGIFAINASTGEITIADPSNLNYEAAPQYTLTVQVGDGVNTSATETLVIDIVDVNEAPTFTSAPLTAATEDALYSYTITTNDVDGDVLSINGLAVPAWLTLVDNGDGTATLSGTPTNAEVGPHTVELEVSDGSLTATQSFTLTVSNVNDAPVITSPATFNVAENSTAVGTVTSTDVDGGAPQYTLIGSVDDGLFSIDVNSGALSFNAAPDFESPADSGGDNVYNLTVQVDDGNGGIVSQAVTVTVTDINEIGITAISDTDAALETAPENATTGTAVGITAFADDADGTDTVSYSLDDDAGGLFSINTNTGVVTVNGALDYETATSHSITVRATSTDTSFTTQSFTIAVGDVNDNAPVITAAQTFSVNEDALVNDVVGTVAATDIDTIGSLQGWTITAGNTDGIFAINASTGEITIADTTNLNFEATPQYTLSVQVGDGVNTSATETLVIDIVDVNEAPTFTSAPTTAATEDTPYSYTITTNDVDGDVLSINGLTVPAWLTLIDNGDGTATLSGTPTNAEVGDHSLSLEVSDGTLTATQSFTLTVTNVNDDPVITSPATFSVAENSTAVGTVTSTDVDGGAPQYTLIGAVDDGLFSIDVNSGALSFNAAPDFEAPADSGGDNVYNLTVQVDDGNGGIVNQAVTVTVTNVNEAGVSPVSDIDAAADAVAEDATVGTTVHITADASDPDAGDTVSYSLDDDAGGLFAINASSGVVTVNGALDYETATSHSITVRATSTDASFTTQSFTIAVGDVNDNAPVITAAQTFSVNEDALVNDVVGTVAATDIDTIGSLQGWTITAGNTDGIFAINASTGEITIADTTNLNFEATPQYTLSVQVGDGVNTSATETLVIDIVDVNEAPTFTSAPATTATEDTPYSYTITTNDVDGDAVSISGLTVPVWLTLVDNGDGTATLSGTPTDAEVGDHSVSLEVSDGSLTTTQNFTLTVSNVNDDPVITSPATFNVAENSTAVGTVTSTDVDGGAPQYTLIGAVDDGLFSIDVNSGALSFNAAPDFEAPADSGGDNVYNLTVQVDDGNGGIVSQAVTVTVTDINEIGITAISDTDAALETAPENSTAGTAVGITAFADDADGTDTVSYSLDDDAGGLFSIDTNTGVVTVNGALDYETATSHSITVRAASTDGSASTRSFTINITDVNESGVTAISDSDAALDTVAENASVGTSVGVTAFADDADLTDTVSYSLDDDAGGLFAVDGLTGAVTVNGALDYESSSSHNITLRATSTDGSTTTRVFSIAISDVNDNAPVITAAQTFSVNEDALVNDVVGTVAATDVDTVGSLQGWTITAGNADGVFAINAATGEITIADPSNLNFEATPQYTLTVQVSDGVNTSATETLVIDVNDVNEAPTFTSAPLTTATEDALYSYTITTNDVDGDVLSINGLTVPAWLTLIDNGDGTATLSGTPTDAEVGDHSVSLEVSDGSLTTTQNFTLTVSNVNDDPVITSPATFNVAENSTAVGTVTSTDVDGGAPQYTLIGAVDDGLFSIDVNSGALSFNAAPDFEAPADSGGDNVYNLTVQVDDGNGGIANQAITVTVTNVNEAGVSPVNDINVSADAVAEDATVGTTVGITADASDPDAGDTVTYGLDDDAGGLFSIDANTGVVTVNGVLDYETDTSHSITVRATSTDTSFTTQSFTIAVGDVNDNAPVVTAAQTFSVNEDAALNDVVGTVTATDADSVGSLQGWTITAGNTDGIFAINTSTGEITVADPSNLNYEAAPQYTLTVQVGDGINTSATETLVIDIVDVNEAPTFTSAAVTAATEDTLYSYTITTNDVDGDVLSINGLTVPAWLTLTDNGDGTATLSGTPTNAEVGDHSLSLEVSDGSLTATQSFTLTVSNVNDDPVITSPASFTVAENSTAVGTVTSTDVDGGAPQYTLIGAVDDGLFSIDVNSGALSFNAAPDFEAPADSGGDNVYNLTVQVDDGNGGIVNQAVTVTVTNVNEAGVSPVSDIDAAADAVAEDATVGTTVGITADAGDPDAGDTVSYSLDDDAGGLFAINASTGVVTVNGALDYETATSHSITVRATSTDTSFTTQNFTIAVGDVNDNAPVITATQTFSVNEDALVNDVVGTVAATDADSVGSLQGWTITAGNTDGIFAINAATGEITIADTTNLNFEATPQYTLTVQVGDGINTSATETLVIDINDVNEAPGLPALSNASVNENIDTSAGYPVGTLSAPDMDAGDLMTFEIIGGLDSDVFSIGGLNGDELVIDDGLLDYERQSSYDVRIRVTDSGGLFSERDFAITVNDLNDAPQPGADVLTVMEDSALVIDLATDLLANDLDQDSDPLTVVGMAQPANGVLMDNLDGTWTYLANANYSGPDQFQYQVSDPSGAIASVTVNIDVLPVNDAPTLSMPGSVSVGENATGPVAAIQASDVDGDPISLQLGGADSGSFTLDPSTGEIRFNSAPDFEGPADAGGDNQYQLQVTASDGAGGSVSLPISIDVTDVNEAPELLSTDFSGVQGYSGSVGSVQFSDPDFGDQIQITAVGGSGANLFSVDPTSGQITQSGDSLPGVYTLEVQLTDTQGATATGTLTITLGSLTTETETSISKSIIDDQTERNSDPVDTGAVQDPESGTEETRAESGDGTGESAEASAADEVPGRVSPTEAAFTGIAIPGNQTGVESSSERPERIPGQGGHYTRGAHTMVLELLLEETDELMEIALRQATDTGLDLSSTSLSLSPSMLGALQEMRAEVDAVANQDEEKTDLLVNTGAVATVSLTAGFVTWLLRTGSLLATVLSTSPLWRPFDPIPVLVDLNSASRPDSGKDTNEAS